MAKRIAAYFLDPAEKARAIELLGKDAVETEGFLVAEADDSTIAKLRDAKLIVQEYPEAPRPEPAAPARLSPMAKARRAREAFIETLDVNPAPKDYYRLMLRGPVIEAWRSQLDTMGISLGDAVDGGYRVKLDLADVPRAKALPFVASVDWIQPTASAPATVTQAVGAALATRILQFDVRVNNPGGVQTVLAWLAARNVTIVGSTAKKIRIQADENAQFLNELSTLPDVDTIAEYVRPKIFNDLARVVLAIDCDSAGQQAICPSFLKQDGTGQIVGVADTGIDDQHPDLKNQLAGKVALGRHGDTSDPHGHGTHVAGSIAGDGTSSSQRVRGAAPGAKLFFQSLMDAAGNLGGMPLDLNDLFAEAYSNGARIHNNSWGSSTASTYTMSSEEVDQFVHDHPDMLVVIAAGNDGRGARPFHSATGFVDWLSIGSPASSKNALTVGASRSPRTDGPNSAKTWGAVWPSDFPDDPIRSQGICGDAQSLAAFSARGPIDDHRIKPDLVAPGTDILSTLSSKAPIGNFFGSGAPTFPGYAYDCGTSMATPLVSGCAALVRQYYVDVAKHKPSAALLKATLINSTEWLTGDDANAEAKGTPNFHQGFGRVSMARAIPNSKDPGFTIQFLDEWENKQASLSRTGERRRYNFALEGGTKELRFCLAYTDAPARALQNNINLIVQHVDSGKKWTGNSALPQALTTLDTTNNVESIRIVNPDGGNYIVQIVASNLLKPPQDFALVVSGTGVPVLNRLT